MYKRSWISFSCRLSGAPAGVKDRCSIYTRLHIRLEYITINALATVKKKKKIIIDMEFPECFEQHFPVTVLFYSGFS